jgi:amino acid permease
MERVNDAPESVIPPEFDRKSNRYPYCTVGQPIRAWLGLIACVIIITFNGWEAFWGEISVKDLFGSYLAVRHTFFVT